MEAFRVERGDVLLSIQLILTHEEEWRRRQLAKAGAPAAPAAGSGRPRPAEAPLATPRPRPLASASTPARPSPGVGPPSPVRPSASSAANPHRNGARPGAVPVMIDPLTGVGTVHALRRDLMLAKAWPGPGRPTPVLVAVEVDALDQIRLAKGAEAGDHVIKCLVEVAPFALRSQDRVYRSGRNQLTLLLPGTNDAGAESARSGLETGLQRRLAGRGYPEISLSARKLDAIALAS